MLVYLIDALDRDHPYVIYAKNIFLYPPLFYPYVFGLLHSLASLSSLTPTLFEKLILVIITVYGELELSQLKKVRNVF